MSTNMLQSLLMDTQLQNLGGGFGVFDMVATDFNQNTINSTPVSFGEGGIGIIPGQKIVPIPSSMNLVNLMGGAGTNDIVMPVAFHQPR